MSLCSQIFSVDFCEFLLKRRHLKNLKNSANKFIKNKKFNLFNDEKEIFDSKLNLLRKFQLRNMFLNVNLFNVEFF